jgi:hypothetical protein
VSVARSELAAIDGNLLRENAVPAMRRALVEGGFRPEAIAWNLVHLAGLGRMIPELHRERFEGLPSPDPRTRLMATERLAAIFGRDLREAQYTREDRAEERRESLGFSGLGL